MQYFPLFLKLEGKPVLVVGGGDVASRKVEALLRANAIVTVVSPEISDYLKDCADKQRLNWIQGCYNNQFITNQIQVWATTDDSELNHQVHSDAKKRNILVNVVDDKPYCDFITPSMINRGNVQIAISSGGGSPVLIRNLREKIESVLAHNTGLLADFASSKRDEIKIFYKTVDDRRRFWEQYFARPEIELIENMNDLQTLYEESLNGSLSVTPSRIWVEFGQDVELISIKTLRIMQQTELVLYPENCPFEFIDLCRRDAERIVYKEHQELQRILTEYNTASLKNICIFMPKDDLKHDDSMRDLAGNDMVLRVVD